MLLSSLGILSILDVAILEDVFVDVRVLEADCVVGLDAIWRIARVSGFSWGSSPSNSLLAILPLEFGSVSISSPSSLLEVVKLVVLASTPLAPCCYCCFRSISAILCFICS